MMRERAYYKAPQICSGVPDMRYARLVATTLLGMLLCAFPASYFTGAVVRAARARKSLTRNQAIVLPQLAVLTPFFPQLAAPNPAPKTEVYRTCTEHFMGSIRKAEFSQAVTASLLQLPQQVSVHSAQSAGSGWRWQPILALV
ncbi:MAG: hypothetical protein DMG50_06830 [Acidobacteria bacterium]|nr:MAG: hypothetical protein DMG50_06830 [Acidobacteriota bacterium]